MAGCMVEELTHNFYRWEQRGRGWQFYDRPVDLEPPFEPFWHTRTQKIPVDDGRKPTFWSTLVEAFRSPAAPPEHEASEDIQEEDLSPPPFQCDLEVTEVGLELPRTEKVDADYVGQLLLNLASCTWPISFELIGSGESISVQIATRTVDSRYVNDQLKAHFPGIVLKEGRNLSTLLDRHPEVLVVDVGLDAEFMRPVRTFNSFDPDPLAGVFGALEGLSPGELGIIQVLFQGVWHAWSESILRSVTDGRGEPFFIDAPEMVPYAKEKVSKPLFAAALRVIGRGETVERSETIIRGILGGLAPLGDPRSNELILLTDEGYGQGEHIMDVTFRRSRRPGMLLNSGELAGLVHPPSPSICVQKLRGEFRKTKAPPIAAKGHLLVLGENLHQGASTKVSLSREQRLRHVHVIGGTGTGKSTLLLNMIVQDMGHDEGLAVLDPHGDLIDAILERVPEAREGDVVLFDPSDEEAPVGLNVLRADSEAERTVLESDLVAIFRRFATSWGDQMTAVLGNAVSAFLESREGGTLLDLRRFLIEKDFRNGCLKGVVDPEIVYFWQKQFPLLRGSPMSSILTRLDAFLRPKPVRNIVGQLKGLDCSEIINTKKIFLVKLAQGLIGEENSYLLGSLLVSKLHQAVTARQTKDESEREPFYLYIDEFQHFMTPSMAAVLSGARKYGLGLVLAHQDLRQLWTEDTQLANSLMTNPVTRICFRLGDFDAEKLQGGFSFFDATDLQNLGVGEAIVRVERKDWDFNLQTFSPPRAHAVDSKRARENAIALSRKKYGRAIAKPEPTPVKVTPPTTETSPVVPIERECKKMSEATLPNRPSVPLPELPSVIEDQKHRAHRYLQTLIKKIAEDRGYKAVIEEPTPDGTGRVDVGLQRGEEKLAIEISVTTSDMHELQNIRKCLCAGYAMTIVCSPERKNLKAIKDIAGESLEVFEQERVVFLDPDELVPFFDARIPQEIVQEERVKGYRVKVHYQPASETDRKRKDDAVKRVIVQALQRMKRT